LKLWKQCDVFEERPPPLILETYLDTRYSTTSHHNGDLDILGAVWTSPTDVILERREIQLKNGDIPRSGDFNQASLIKTYKNCIVIYRSLYTITKLLPAWRSFLHARTEAPGAELGTRINRWHPRGVPDGTRSVEIWLDRYPEISRVSGGYRLNYYITRKIVNTSRQLMKSLDFLLLFYISDFNLLSLFYISY